MLTGHDAETGQELWRWGTWNPRRITHWRLVPSPVVGQGVILACAPKREPIYAIVPNGTGRLDDGALAWIRDEAKEIASDVPTPAFYAGDSFVLSDVRKCLLRDAPPAARLAWALGGV